MEKAADLNAPESNRIAYFQTTADAQYHRTDGDALPSGGMPTVRYLHTLHQCCSHQAFTCQLHLPTISLHLEMSQPDCDAISVLFDGHFLFRECLKELCGRPMTCRGLSMQSVHPLCSTLPDFWPMAELTARRWQS